MEMRHTERTHIRRPIEPPIDLDTGRLDIARAALAGAFVLGSLVVILLGAWIVAGATSGYQVNIIGVVFGGGVVAIALTFGGVVLYVSVYEWLDHRQRVQDWHAVSLNAYEELGAVETVEQVNEWSFTVDNPAHVLLAALWTHQRLQEGIETPHSVRALYGPVFLAGRRVGEVGKLTAEQMGRKFEDLGLVVGRGERRAGSWVPEDLNEVWSTVLKNWK